MKTAWWEWQCYDDNWCFGMLMLRWQLMLRNVDVAPVTLIMIWIVKKPPVSLILIIRSIMVVISLTNSCWSWSENLHQKLTGSYGIHATLHRYTSPPHFTATLYHYTLPLHFLGGMQTEGISDMPRFKNGTTFMLPNIGGEKSDRKSTRLNSSHS